MFKLKPIVLFVHQALAELEAQILYDAYNKRSTKVRKPPVYQTASEYKVAVIEAFRIMMDAGVEFPLTNKQRGLQKIFAEAQHKTLPIDRRIIMNSVPQRQKLISALNYRYKRYQQDLADAAMLQSGISVPANDHSAKSKQLAPSTAVPAVTTNDNSVFEMGQMAGAYLSSDANLMKQFMTGLVSAFVKA